MIEANAGIRSALLYDDVEVHQQAVQETGQGLKIFKELLAQDPEQAEIINRVIEATQNFQNYAITHEPAFSQDNLAIHEQWEEITGKLLDYFAQMQNMAIKSTEERTSFFVVDLAFDQKLLLGGTVLALILGLLIAFFITRTITRPVKATMNILNRLSHSDFTVRVEPRLLARGDELGQMLRDVQVMTDNLSQAIQQIEHAAHTVTMSADEIAQGNQELNARPQTQAGSVEQTSSALEQMTASVHNNASNAEQANSIAQEAMKVAQDGDTMLSRTVAAMDEVSQVSKKINDIVGVVNEIAFQTNLLALNASVEAARAGEAGRGFAVVAGEVRTLAGRTATASKEIQNLITDSSNKVAQGNSLVNESSAILRQTIDNVTKVAESISHITTRSREQAGGIGEINSAVSLMDQAVQQNATLVEEITAASENMTSATREMQHQLGQFIIEQGRQVALLPE